MRPRIEAPRLALAPLLVSLVFGRANAQTVTTNDPPFYGPFNAVFLPDGDGLEKKLGEHDSVLLADSPWSLYCWIWLEEELKAPTLIAGMGDPNEEYPRYLALDVEKVTLWLGKDNSIAGNTALALDKWMFVAATFDGDDFRLNFDGQQVASGKLALGSVTPVLHIAPPNSPACGVPQPIINDGLAALTRTLDSTRYYSPSSNQVNLENSGPYKYMDPVLYYSALNHGFAVETVAVTPGVTLETGDAVIETVKLDNRGNVAALETKLTLLDSQGERILPAYFSDNCISLLPGEVKVSLFSTIHMRA